MLVLMLSYSCPVEKRSCGPETEETNSPYSDCIEFWVSQPGIFLRHTKACEAIAINVVHTDIIVGIN